MTTWLKDANGNRCSVEYFGSAEAAQEALDSLVNCQDCENCSGCSDCSDCSDCYGCSRCSDCFGCSDCYGCSRCSGCSCCSRCSHCFGCSDCSDCFGCSDCSRCSRCSCCSRCSRCSDCSDCSCCSRCSGCSCCSDCSDCSCCSGCSDKAGLQGNFVAPIVPVIPNIHAAVYAAASAPKALDMSDWHICGTTHCRAGWVVHLAGEAGYALERFHNTALAAQLIYAASGYEINPYRFYDSNADALADMRRLAEDAPGA